MALEIEADVFRRLVAGVVPRDLRNGFRDHGRLWKRHKAEFPGLDHAFNMAVLPTAIACLARFGWRENGIILAPLMSAHHGSADFASPDRNR